MQRYEIGQEDVFRQPSSNVVKLKIMSYLSKSKVAAESFPSALQVSFDCLYGRSAGVWEDEKRESRGVQASLMLTIISYAL